jgi:hypothetical protein
MSAINPMGGSAVVSVGTERSRRLVQPQTEMKRPPTNSGPEVAKADPGSVQMSGGSEGTSLPSPNISSQRGPTHVVYNKYGHSVSATLAGNVSDVPTKVTGLGINLPAPKGRIDAQA